MSIVKMFLTSLFMLVMSFQVGLAQGLSSNDLAFAFGGDVVTGQQEVQRSSAPAPQHMSLSEMEATEGEFWPIVHGAAVIGTRAVMWAAPRVMSRYRTIHNARSNHTIMVNTRTGCHVCQVGRDRNGHHVGWGSGGRNGSAARNHIYHGNPWRINPF